jgi:hypothetical protein
MIPLLLSLSGRQNPGIAVRTRSIIMRRSLVALFLILALLRRSHAQAAPVGRLRLLDPPGEQARCVRHQTSEALRRSGIDQIFNVEERGPRHLLSLGVTPHNTARLLMVAASTVQARRREGESISVLFGEDGAIIRGERSAFTTGTPARRSDDRKLGLFPRDSAQVFALVRAIRTLCRA